MTVRAPTRVRFRTRGELLRDYVQSKLGTDDAWSRLPHILAFGGRGTELTAFFRDVAAITVTNRLVAAAVPHFSMGTFAADSAPAVAALVDIYLGAVPELQLHDLSNFDRLRVEG